MMISLVFQKEFKNDFRNPRRFILEILSILLRIFLLFVISNFISANGDIAGLNTEKFYLFLMLGFLFLETINNVSASIIRALQKYKDTGIIEQVLKLPISTESFLISHALYPSMLMILKFFIYLFLSEIFIISFLNIHNFLFVFLIYFLFILTTIILSVGLTGVSLFIEKPDMLLVVNSILNLVFGAVFFTAQFLPGFLQLFSNLFPIFHTLSAARELVLNHTIPDYSFYLLIGLMVLIYGSCSLIFLKKGLIHAKNKDKLLI